MSGHDPLFIVGTGRCGSTMLSELVRAHPQLASLSEVFTMLTDLGGRISECFPAEPLDGPALWRVLGAAPPKLSAMLRYDVAMDEVLFRPAPGARFGVAQGVPALLQTALPHLFDAPEAVFEQLERFVLARPRAAVGEHYRETFAWLAARLGRERWVERSGGSLRIVGRLAACFPGARFVHIVRDGRNCAMSMSRHLGFRMALIVIQLTEILGVDPWESSDRTHERDVPDELVPFLPERFDREAFLRYEVAPPLCGHYWSGEIMAGLAELAALAPARVLTLRYEDFGHAPHASIARLFEFLGVGAPAAWVDRAAGIVRPARSRWTELSPREQRSLHAACEPGFAALAGVYPEVS